MRAIVAGGLLACLTSCSKPSPPVSPAASVYAALVDAGCLKADDAGLPSVQAEYESGTAPAWFQCLWGGGTVASCNVPCGASLPRR
jgi:hypothetical protein